MEISTTCPACGYTRTPNDDAPEWQCPKCQKAYAKTARLLHRDETVPPSVSPGNPEKEGSNHHAGRAKTNRFVTSLLVIALLGASLFFLFQPEPKENTVSPEPAIPARDVQLTFQLLSSAHGQYGFMPQSGDQWEKASETWVRQSMVAAQHVVKGGSLGLKAAAQSFVPRCDIIRAIQVSLYPVGAPGWLRFEITGDAGGSPGEVLDTAWLRVDPGCPVPHGGYMTVPFADVAVNPTDTYWFTVVDFRDARDSGYHVTNLNVSETDSYPDGRLLLPPRYAVPGIFDASFRIIRDFKTLPGLRAASYGEKRFLPNQAEQEAVREIWTQEKALSSP